MELRFQQMLKTKYTVIFILVDIFYYWDKSAIYFSLDLKRR